MGVLCWRTQTSLCKSQYEKLCCNSYPYIFLLWSTAILTALLWLTTSDIWYPWNSHCTRFKLKSFKTFGRKNDTTNPARSPRAAQAAQVPNPVSGSRIDGTELHGVNVSLTCNLGSNKTSCGICGSVGEEVSQEERWHTDETKITDT